MAFAKAKTALALLERKLQRALGLAGEIGATFSPELKPTLITGDLREPGYSDFQGRHFGISWFNGAVTAPYYSILFPTDVLITSIIVESNTAAEGACYISAPDEVAASNPAPFQSIGTWVDRKRSGTTDTVPFLIGTLTGSALLGVDRNVSRNVFTWRANNIRVEYWDPIMLAANSHLNFFVSVGTISVSIHGRIFP